MKARILRGRDGRRWITFDGSGRVVELPKDGPAPVSAWTETKRAASFRA